jgi:hypothetical protein
MPAAARGFTTFSRLIPVVSVALGFRIEVKAGIAACA